MNKYLLLIFIIIIFIFANDNIIIGKAYNIKSQNDCPDGFLYHKESQSCYIIPEHLTEVMEKYVAAKPDKWERRRKRNGRIVCCLSNWIFFDCSCTLLGYYILAGSRAGELFRALGTPGQSLGYTLACISLLASSLVLPILLLTSIADGHVRHVHDMEQEFMALVVSMSREMSDGNNNVGDYDPQQFSNINNNNAVISNFLKEEEVQPFHQIDEEHDSANKEEASHGGSENNKARPHNIEKKTRGSKYKISKKETLSYNFPILNLNVHKIDQLDKEHVELMKRTKRLVDPIIWWLVVLLIMWCVVFFCAMMAFTSVAFEFATVCFFFFCTTVVGLYKFVNVLASVGDRYNIFIGNLKSPNVCTLSNRLFNQPFYLAQRFEDFQIQKKHTFTLFNNVLNSNTIQRVLMSMALMFLFTFAPGLIRTFFS